jgi:hypothetical protein
VHISIGDSENIHLSSFAKFASVIYALVDVSGNTILSVFFGNLVRLAHRVPAVTDMFILMYRT